MVIFSGGVVGKFGEEKVNPLSVPASNGCKSKVTSCFHCPPSHRFRLSTPTNQSGLGITFTIRDSWEKKHNTISQSHTENVHTEITNANLPNGKVLVFFQHALLTLLASQVTSESFLCCHFQYFPLLPVYVRLDHLGFFL